MISILEGLTNDSQVAPLQASVIVFILNKEALRRNLINCGGLLIMPIMHARESELHRGHSLPNLVTWAQKVAPLIIFACHSLLRVGISELFHKLIESLVRKSDVGVPRVD